MQHIADILPNQKPSKSEPTPSRSGTKDKQSIFSNNEMCPCGKSGRFHACTLGTQDEPDLCNRCGGLGRYAVNPDLRVWHPDYYADCTCPLSKRRGDWALAHRAIIDALNEISQAPDRDMIFDNFDPEWPTGVRERQNLKETLGLARQFAASPEAWSMTLVGSFGCGKTHLGRAMQQWRNDPANDVAGAAFIVVPDLLDYVKATFGREATERYDERFDRIRNAPMLILDDMGVEHSTSWVKEKLFQIVNHRYNHNYPTVVLTNVPLENLEGRIASRLHEGIVQPVVAGDYRGRE